MAEVYPLPSPSPSPDKPRLTRLRQPRRYRTSGIELYLEDIEALEAIFREVSTEVELRADEFRAPDSQALSDLRQETVSELELSSNRPYIRLESGSRGIYLYVGSDDPASVYAYDKIVALLEQRRWSRWRRVLLDPLNFALIITLLFIVVGVFFVNPWLKTATGQSFDFTLATWASTVFSLCVLLAQGRRAFRSVWVYPKYRCDTTTFWKAKRHDIWLLVVGGVIGWLIPRFFTWLDKVLGF